MNHVAVPRFAVRLDQGDDGLAGLLPLRARIFRPGAPQFADRDDLDADCHHLSVIDRADGSLVACCRLLVLSGGAEVGHSYSARSHDLSPLAAYPAPLIEVGRLCVAQGRTEPDILRCLFAGMARLVDRTGARMLFGCASFPGTSPEPHRDALALLAERHLGPDRWRPGRGAGEAIDLLPFAGAVDDRAGLAAMPALLRTYLGLGGWVGDHAVIDRDLDTLHVFTALELSRIPPARARLLRAAGRALALA